MEATASTATRLAIAALEWAAPEEGDVLGSGAAAGRLPLAGATEEGATVVTALRPAAWNVAGLASAPEGLVIMAATDAWLDGCVRTL